MKIRGKYNISYTDGTHDSGAGKKIISKIDDIQDIIINGEVEFDNLRCHQLKVNGRLSGKKIDAYDIDVTGNMHVSEISANLMLAKLSGSNSIDVYKGKTLRIKKEDGGHPEIVESFISKLFGEKINLNLLKNEPNDMQVTMQLIEAEEINLVNTDANKVIAKDVELKSKCSIEELKYSGELKQDRSSKINKIIH